MEHERLTQRNSIGGAYYPYCMQEATCYGMGASVKCNGCEFNNEVLEKLATYEDLEEQGLLLRLPVSDGFTDDLLNMGYTKGYHKAIDEFVEALVKHTHKIPSRCLGGANVLEIAEQMKAGADNE